MELTQRQDYILKVIVEQYIALAHPVGSAAIAAASGLGISSATVRNEVGTLEAAGLVHQLHTSGGRVPTNAGYRYYVERLMQRAHVGQSEARTIRHQFHQAHSEVEEWLRLAATIMAHRMHNVGLVTAPRPAEVRLRHLEVISIHDSVALLIVVLHDGTVLQEMAALAQPRTQDELSALATGLNGAFSGRTASEVEGALGGLTDLAGSIGELVARLLRRAEERHAQVFHAGLSDMIRQPEFSGQRPGEPAAALNERLREMVDFLQHGFAVQRFVMGLPSEADVHVVIGGDSGPEALHDYSFVLGRYGDRENSRGYLGIVGPTRMEYPRAVALVRYMTDLMTDLMTTY